MKTARAFRLRRAGRRRNQPRASSAAILRRLCASFFAVSSGIEARAISQKKNRMEKTSILFGLQWPNTSMQMPISTGWCSR